MNIHTFIYDKTACPIHDYDNEKKKKKLEKKGKDINHKKRTSRV